MKLRDEEILSQLASAAASFNEGFKEREYPEVQLANFVSITQKGDESIDALDYGEIEGTQDLENGLIDENTTSLETEDLNIVAKKGLYLSWAKSAVYTSEAVARAKRLDIELDTAKLSNLERVALLTMQKTALVGHTKLPAVQGLLNNSSVKAKDLTAGAAISAMTGAEARAFFLSLIEFGYEQNGGLLIPNTIAIDSKDLMALASKYDNSIGAVNGGVNALTAIKEALSQSTGVDVNIVGIPLGFAQGLGGGKGKNRAVVYTKSEDVLSTDWALSPTAMQPFQRSVLSWEIAVKAKFTGTLIRQLDKVAYVNYKA